MTRYQVGDFRDVYFVVDTDIPEGEPRILAIGPDFWSATEIKEKLNHFEEVALAFYIRKKDFLPANVVRFTGGWTPSDNN